MALEEEVVEGVKDCGWQRGGRKRRNGRVKRSLNLINGGVLSFVATDSHDTAYNHQLSNLGQSWPAEQFCYPILSVSVILVKALTAHIRLPSTYSRVHPVHPPPSAATPHRLLQQTPCFLYPIHPVQPAGIFGETAPLATMPLQPLSA
jgi:hypothetical protein